MVLVLKYFKIILFVFEIWTLTSVQSVQWNLHGKPGDGYYLTVNIGQPQQTFNLLVDTGSSNLAIAGASYPGLESYFEPSKSTTFVNNETTVKVAYTQGWWTGIMGQDIVQVPSIKNISAVMTDLSIITATNGFYVNNSHWQGILGLAYSEIAKPQGLVRSWFDTINLEYPQITHNRFDLQLCGPKPFPHKDVHVGKLSVGDFEPACPKSEYSSPIRHQWYYEVVVVGLKIGEHDVSIPCSDFNNPKTIVDSGTSNLQLSSKSYYYVISELQVQTERKLSLPEKFWDGLQEICFTQNEEPWSLFPTLTIFLNHDNDSYFGIKVPPTAYLRPALNVSNINQGCWLLGIEESHIGTVLGTVVLEGLCIIFDREAGLLSFSKANCGPDIELLQIKNRTDSVHCNFVEYVLNGPLIATIIILLMILMPLGLAFARWVWFEFVRNNRVNRVPFVSLEESST